jgi:hypothetical protein
MRPFFEIDLAWFQALDLAERNKSAAIVALGLPIGLQCVAFGMKAIFADL